MNPQQPVFHGTGTASANYLSLGASTQVLLSIGEGQMVNLPRSVSSVWTSNPKVADVYVNSSRQINLFGKDAGEVLAFLQARLQSKQPLYLVCDPEKPDRCLLPEALL